MLHSLLGTPPAAGPHCAHCKLTSLLTPSFTTCQNVAFSCSKFDSFLLNCVSFVKPLSICWNKKEYRKQIRVLILKGFNFAVILGVTVILINCRLPSVNVCWAESMTVEYIVSPGLNFSQLLQIPLEVSLGGWLWWGPISVFCSDKDCLCRTVWWQVLRTLR